MLESPAEDFGLSPERAEELRQRAKALLDRFFEGDPDADGTLKSLEREVFAFTLPDLLLPGTVIAGVGRRRSTT